MLTLLGLNVVITSLTFWHGGGPPDGVGSIAMVKYLILGSVDVAVKLRRVARCVPAKNGDIKKV
jgi:hypothetical protein